MLTSAGPAHAVVAHALRTNAMRPVYQPVVRLQDGELAGFEVLARWRHETLGPVPPAEFLPIVEQAGLLADFTRHMVVSACTAAATWSGAFWLSFNVEAAQLVDHALPGLLAEAVGQTGFAAERVIIEVRQDAFMSDPDRANPVMGRLAEHGFRLALADVGRGSDMRLLLSMPFSILKLDRELIRTATERADAKRGVAGVLGLAKGLDVPVVATGIETEAQAGRLRDLGCGLGQGWLFGEGLPDILAGGMAAAPRTIPPFLPYQVLSDMGARQAGAAQCAVFAEMLDGLGLAFCLFDDDDRTMLWNRTFVEFFPEHRGHLSKGEPYRENLRRFYEARLQGDERQNIERYIIDGIARHHAQSRPFSFHHRGRRLCVASLPFPGGDRARIWQDEGELGEAASGAQEPWHGAVKLARRYADGYASLDKTDRVTSVNGEFLRLYNADTAEQVLGLTLVEIVRQAWFRHVKDGFEEAVALPDDEFADNTRFAGAPFEVRMPDNQWRRVLEHRDSTGLGHSVHSDITVMKREQEELRNTREMLRQRNAELAMLAGTDGLTGVANRRRFGEALANLWSRAANDGTAIALLLIDVDHFKAVNDRFGHPGGDECLRQVAASLNEIIRSPNDLVARYGGEEFAIILPNTDAASVLAVAERVRHDVARQQADTFQITVSVGCLSVQPGAGRVAGSADMIEQVDMALYRAKRNGRNRVEVA